MNEFFKILPQGTEDNDYIVICGNVQATSKHFQTVKAAQEYINSKPWDLIFTLAYAANKALKNQEEEESKTKEG